MEVFIDSFFPEYFFVSLLQTSNNFYSRQCNIKCWLSIELGCGVNNLFYEELIGELT